MGGEKLHRLRDYQSRQCRTWSLHRVGRQVLRNAEMQVELAIRGRARLSESFVRLGLWRVGDR
jgi:hypothetical protein